MKGYVSDMPDPSRGFSDPRLSVLRWILGKRLGYASRDYAVWQTAMPMLALAEMRAGVVPDFVAHFRDLD